MSTLPAYHGESCVLRILRPDNVRIGIQNMGFEEEDYKIFQKIIRRPNGIFLVTGPTGSGKTTTLYGALNELNRPDRKIITAEDPVEYYLPGINQVEVKHQIGLDFQRIIRAIFGLAAATPADGQSCPSENGSGDVWIEIGAGHGEMTELLAQYARRVIAIEIDSASIAGRWLMLNGQAGLLQLSGSGGARS